ncbi:MAG: class I SAM-dependent methyltransferase, partial [Candidatus Woesearchaeota archaeon]|nr:class I SAM-dependent methyltransferase [Candidatus Woesearchaeota archaeon]
MKSNITEKKILVQKVFNKVFDKYDLMNDIMSLGSHRLWKKQMISWLSPNKNTVLLDMSSGTGDIAKLFLKKIKNKGTVYAVDPNSKMMEVAKKKLAKYNNIKWYLGSAEKLSFKDNYFN